MDGMVFVTLLCCRLFEVCTDICWCECVSCLS